MARALCALLLLVSGVSGAAEAAGGKCQDSGEARATVAALYAAYSGRAIQSEEREVLERYFDDPLVALLLEDGECVRRERGICRIDASIVFWAQDTDISELRVCSLGPEQQRVEARFKNFGVPQTVAYAMRRTARGWRIADVRYGDGSSLAQVLREPSGGSSGASGRAPDWETCSSASRSGAAAIVYDLYAAYPANGPKEVQNESAATLRRYFTEHMVELLREDRACTQREGMCKIDMMILYRSQDPEIANLRVCRPKQVEDGVDVTAVFTDSGHWKTVGYLLEQRRSEWRIANIRYTDGPSLVELLGGQGKAPARK